MSNPALNLLLAPVTTMALTSDRECASLALSKRLKSTAYNKVLESAQSARNKDRQSFHVFTFTTNRKACLTSTPQRKLTDKEKDLGNLESKAVPLVWARERERGYLERILW